MPTLVNKSSNVLKFPISSKKKLITKHLNICISNKSKPGIEFASI